MQMEPRRPPRAWVVPVLVAAVGIPTFLAFWAGGRPGLGAFWASVSVAFGIAIAAGGRSETIRMLRGSEDDERTFALEYQAMTAVAGVLVIALAALFLADGFRGETGIVYAVLLVLAEATHLGALAVLNRTR